MAKTLDGITKGMKVFDIEGKDIGEVESVQAGDEDLALAGTNDVAGTDHNNPVDWVADAFTTDSVPGELRQRLLNEGFVRMDADGFLASDRYLLPSQIGSVSGDRLTLNVRKADLIKV